MAKHSLTIEQLELTARARARAALALRRILAFGVDYLFIAVYIVLLFLVATALGAGRHEPWPAHLVSFVTLTLPVLLYFALFEASPWRATPGKRLLGLEVTTLRSEAASFSRTLARAAVKFAPWELSHSVLHRIEGWPLDPAPLTAAHYGIFMLALALCLWYLASLFLGRTPYDRIAGTQVTARRQHS